MKRLPSEPMRLLDLRPEDDPANLARLVRSAIKAPADPAPRLKWRIRSTLHRGSVRRRRYLRVTVLGGMVFLTGGVVGAVMQPILRLRQTLRVETVENVYPVPTAPHARKRRALSGSDLADSADQALPIANAPSAPPLLPALEPALVPTPAAPTTLESAPAIPLPARSEIAPVKNKPTPARIALVAPSPYRTRSPVPSSPRPAQPRFAAHSQSMHASALDQPSGQSEAPTWSTGQLPPQPIPAPAPLSGQTPMPLGPLPLPTAPLAITPAATATSAPRGPGPARIAPTPAPLVAPPPPSEQALLSRAVRSLRSERRPESALAVLDEYLARFPNGSLLTEATRLRTEALLALGHKAAALAELDRGPPGTAAVGEESRLVRGELRASAGRWREALVDFEAVVHVRTAAGSHTYTSPKLRERFERALWGRASARSHLGDEAGARTDLQECLRRFPRGRFAAQATRLLGELR